MFYRCHDYFVLFQNSLYLRTVKELDLVLIK